MAHAGGLTVLPDFLGVSLVQVYQTLGHEDGAEADKQCEEADVDPGESHGIPSGDALVRDGLGKWSRSEIRDSNFHAHSYFPVCGQGLRNAKQPTH
jgi:hypothetical protein